MCARNIAGEVRGHQEEIKTTSLSSSLPLIKGKGKDYRLRNFAAYPVKNSSYIYVCISSSTEKALEIGCMFKGKQVKRYQIKSKRNIRVWKLVQGDARVEEGKNKKKETETCK